MDSDEEYHPDYFANVVKHQNKGDVLVFCYDLVSSRSEVGDSTLTWDPATAQQDFFLRSIFLPLGVAHRRSWISRIGSFNELLWCDAEADYWRRLARAGASFAFLPQKSGMRNREANIPQVNLSPGQREVLVNNVRLGKPLYGVQSVRNPPRKIAFISAHCVIDFTSGAAISTLRVLRFLNTLGFECQAYCSSRLDAPEEILLQEILANQPGTPYETRVARIGPYQARLIFTTQGSVPVTVFESASTRGAWTSKREIAAFLTAADIFLKKNRPDVVMTYGGDPVSQELVRLVKRNDIPLVFALRNFSYPWVDTFRPMDYVFVPSDFSRLYHWDKLGLVCHTLPNVLEFEKICAPERHPQYVTFINPEASKGSYVVARIAQELAVRRPDIPILVVEGRRKAQTLKQLGLEHLPTLRMMPNTSDPRQFYGVTKIMLVPSLWNESFGLAAAEAMANGIPVLASNRGSLPEIVGDAGFLFDIPEKNTPASRELPTAEEVAPWVETIIRLWDDEEFYRFVSSRAKDRSNRWRPEQLAPRYREFFSNITHQPGPPIVPKEAMIPNA